MSVKNALVIILTAFLLVSQIGIIVFAEESTSDQALGIANEILNFELKRSSSDSVQRWIDGALSQNAGVSSEWFILALSKYRSYDFSIYRKALEEHISKKGSSSASTREKYALTLAATNGNSEQIKLLLDDSIGKQGIMSWVFGLHILNNGYISDEYDITAVKDKILSLQLENGSWSITGKVGEVDTTAMVLQSLAPYYDENKVRDSVDKSLQYLSAVQLENGGFSHYGVNNCESIAQVIVSLSCLGIDCQYDSRFIKNGTTLFDALYQFRISDGAYSHIINGEYNQMATAQTLCAMVSYLRLNENEPNFYVYNTDTESTDESNIQSQSVLREEEKTTNNDIENDTVPKYKIITIICILIIDLAVCLIMFIKKKHNKQNYLLVLIISVLVIALVLLTNFQTVNEHYNIDSEIESAVGSVTISIKCDVLKSFDDSLNIPDDYTILPQTEVDIRDGDTVYDILMSVTAANRIHIETNGIPENAYVEGIANIYEFDFGDLSGWVYRVNGDSPSVSCGSYKLQPGDKIEWFYSLSLGDDIG